MEEARCNSAEPLTVRCKFAKELVVPWQKAVQAWALQGQIVLSEKCLLQLPVICSPVV